MSNTTRPAKASVSTDGKVIKRKRNVTPIDAKLFVSAAGVPKVFKQLLSVNFKSHNNKVADNKQLVLTYLF